MAAARAVARARANPLLPECRQGLNPRTLNDRVGASHLTNIGTPKEFTRSDGRVGATRSGSTDTPVRARVLTDGTLHPLAGFGGRLLLSVHTPHPQAQK